MSEGTLRQQPIILNDTSEQKDWSEGGLPSSYTAAQLHPGLFPEFPYGSSTYASPASYGLGQRASWQNPTFIVDNYIGQSRLLSAAASQKKIISSLHFLLNRKGTPANAARSKNTGKHDCRSDQMRICRGKICQFM